MTSEKAKTAPGCAICGRPQTDPYRPFCSRRCADVDLQRWLSGAYVVSGTEDDEDQAGGPSGDQS